MLSCLFMEKALLFCWDCLSCSKNERPTPEPPTGLEGWREEEKRISTVIVQLMYFFCWKKENILSERKEVLRRQDENDNHSVIDVVYFLPVVPAPGALAAS